MAAVAQALQAHAPRFICYLANNRRDVDDSLRLRYQVFAREMEVEVEPAFDENGNCLERDAFDAHCRHLLVRDTRSGAAHAFSGRNKPHIPADSIPRRNSI